MHNNKKNFFDTIEKIEPLKRKEFYTTKNGSLWIDEDLKVYFKYERTEKPELIMQYNNQIEQLQATLKTADLYEKVLIMNDISKLERLIKKESESGLVWGRMYCKLEIGQFQEFKEIIQKSDPDNIRSTLFLLGFKSGQEFGKNNLCCNLTDKQLDTMTPTEATSYSEYKNLPRTRENVRE